MTKITKGIIAAVCAAIACAVIITGVVVFTAPQYAGYSVPAPFGLKWGMTCEQIIALGGKDEQGEYPCRLVSELSQGLQGYKYLLLFDKSGGLIKVSAVKQHTNYPDTEVRIIKNTLINAHGPGYGSDGELLDWAWEFEDGSSITLLGGGYQHEVSFLTALSYTTATAHAHRWGTD